MVTANDGESHGKEMENEMDTGRDSGSCLACTESSRCQAVVKGILGDLTKNPESKLYKP